MSKHVYLISGDGLFKIGFSADPQKRVEGLCGYGRVRELIHSFPCGAPRTVEQCLHAFFGPKRVRGEWFNLDTDDVLLICSVRACPTVDDLPAEIRDAKPLVRKKWGRSYSRPGTRTLYVELDAEMFAAMRALASRRQRTLKGEVVLALQMHLAANAEPAAPGGTGRKKKGG